MDATIIEAPSSTKNLAGERDPEMHQPNQTRKGNQWHSGMKAHIGVDAYTGIVHSMSATAGQTLTMLRRRTICCTETRQWCGVMPGIRGVHKRRENLGLEVEWRVAMRPGSRRKQEPGSEEALSAGQQAPDRSSHSLPRSVKHNPGRNGLVQRIPRLKTIL